MGIQKGVAPEGLLVRLSSAPDARQHINLEWSVRAGLKTTRIHSHMKARRDREVGMTLLEAERFEIASLKRKRAK